MSTVKPASTSRFGILGYLVEVAKALTPSERRRAALMFTTITALHVIGFGVFIAVRRPVPLQGARHRRRRARLHARPASRVRRRPHLRDRQHDAQADERGQAAAQRRLLVLARALDDRDRDRCRHRRRREGGVRRRLEQPLQPRAVRRHLRHRRVGDVPVPDRRTQRRHPRRDPPRVPLDAPAAATTKPSSNASCRAAA